MNSNMLELLLDSCLFMPPNPFLSWHTFPWELILTCLNPLLESGFLGYELWHEKVGQFSTELSQRVETHFTLEQALGSQETCAKGQETFFPRETEQPPKAVFPGQRLSPFVLQVVGALLGTVSSQDAIFILKCLLPVIALNVLALASLSPKGERSVSRTLSKLSHLFSFLRTGGAEKKEGKDSAKREIKDLQEVKSYIFENSHFEKEREGICWGLLKTLLLLVVAALCVSRFL